MTGSGIMAEVGKLKALFELKATPPVKISRPPPVNNVTTKSEGTTTPWGIRLRPVNIVRSKSVHNILNKKDTDSPIVKAPRSGSTGNEIDESNLPLPSQMFQKSLRTTRGTTVHASHQSSNKFFNSRPPLAPKPTKKKGKSVTAMLKDQHSRSVDCLADFEKECIEQELISNYPQSPVFPRKSTSPSKEEALQASPAVNNLSPTSQRSSLQDASTIQEDRPVTVQEEAKEKSGTIESQQKNESPLYLRRKPQSPVLVQNMEQISSVIAQQLATSSARGSTATSESTPLANREAALCGHPHLKKHDGLSPDMKNSSEPSTPVFSGSPLMSSQMIEEIFERSKSALKVSDVDDDTSPHPVLEYSCSPPKPLGSRLNSGDYADEDDDDDNSDSFYKKVKDDGDKDELMFQMEYNKNSIDTDSKDQLRLSDGSSENEGMLRSPLLNHTRDGSGASSPSGNEKLSKVIY